MTNPYAPPDERIDPNRSQGSLSLQKQFLWQAAAGAAYLGVFLFVYSMLPASDDMTKSCLAVVPLVFGTQIRTWFCGSYDELFTASLAVSLGFLWSLLIFIFVQSGTISIDWMAFAIANLISPVLLGGVCWPVMALGQRTRQRHRSE